MKKTQRQIGTQKYCRFCERTENGRAAKQQYIALCPHALMVAPAVAHLGPGPSAHLQTARPNRPKTPSNNRLKNARWSPRRALGMPETPRHHAKIKFVYRGRYFCVPDWDTNLCTNLCTATRIFVYQFVYRDKDLCVPACLP